MVIINIVFYLFTAAIEHSNFFICAILRTRSLLLIKVKGIKLIKEPISSKRYKALKGGIPLKDDRDISMLE